MTCLEKRPEGMFSPEMAKIGIDLGGTAIKIARVEGERILAETSVQTPQSGPTDVLTAAADAVLRLDPSPSAVGLAIPGEVDATGVCYRLPNIAGFENVNVAGIMAPLVKCPVSVENDGNAAAHGEALYGLGRKYKSFAMITLGTGIGGGLVLDGKVRTGAYGFAAELGHIPVDNRANAYECGCGQTGCVESYAGTHGILRKFREMGGAADDIRTVSEAVRNNDPAGIAAFDMMARSLARCVTIIQNILDLDAIVFTGGISRSFDLIEPRVRDLMAPIAFSTPLANIPLLVSELGARAGAIGSAHLDRLKAQ